MTNASTNLNTAAARNDQQTNSSLEDYFEGAIRNYGPSINLQDNETSFIDVELDEQGGGSRNIKVNNSQFLQSNNKVDQLDELYQIKQIETRRKLAYDYKKNSPKRSNWAPNHKPRGRNNAKLAQLSQTQTKGGF